MRVHGASRQRMRRADRANVLLGAVEHHVADRLAGDAGGCRHPADELAVMAIEGESEARRSRLSSR